MQPLIRKIEMTMDLADLIVFMVNSYIRPTDIKNMQHQHVDVIKNDERQYLRLRLPPSKGHSYPITTMRGQQSFSNSLGDGLQSHGHRISFAGL